MQVVTLPGDSPRYESAGHAHHHHFQCEACGRVFDVHACPGDLSSMAPAGFQVSHHELTLYGLCADCRQSTAARIVCGGCPLAGPLRDGAGHHQRRGQKLADKSS